LQLGRKITQQERINICIQYTISNFDDILALASVEPQLTPVLAEEIIKDFEQFKDTPYDKKTVFPKEEDEEIYTL
jgi:hypothetical protein